MEIGVNLTTMMNQAMLSTQQQTASLAQLQAEASTGNAVINPSDNPAAMTAIMAAQSQNDQLGAYLTNIQSATATLNAGVAAMNQASSIMTQAQQIATEGSQSTETPQSLQALADQVNGLLNQLIGAANTQNGNQYLFSGADPQTKPFSITSVNAQGNPQTVTYNGAADSAETIVGPQQSVATMDPGSQVFQSTQPDAFQVLINLRDDLNNTAGLSAHDQTAAIGNTIGQVQNVNNAILTSVGQQSATLQFLQGQQSNVQSLQLAAQQLTSNLQSADIPTVVTQLQAEQNQLQLTLAATASVLQQANLLEFLK